MTKRTFTRIDPEFAALSDEAMRFKRGETSFATIDGIYSIQRRMQVEPTRWFVAYVAPGSQGGGQIEVDGKDREGRVEKFIERAGLEVYWPKARRPKRVPLKRRGEKRKFKTVEIVSPVLPRYVLVKMPARNTPFGLLTTEEAQFNGICGLVGTADGPSYVPDEIVEAIMAREDQGEFNKVRRQGRKTFAQLPDWASPGARVRISDGPFATFGALIQDQIGEGRLRVSVEIFGRSAPIDIEMDQIERM